jgi:hypothetical protein
MPRIGSPVSGVFDSRPDALVGHRLVIEARDDMQMGVEAALIVPAERVAVGSEPLVQLGLYEKQEFACRRPLLGGQVERRSPVSFRDDDAAARHYVGRVTRVPGRGVDANVVLEIQIRLAQPIVIAKDAAFCHKAVLLVGRSEQTRSASVSPGSSALGRDPAGQHDAARECPLVSQDGL